MKVSVRIITYNHEKFIAQAIDSALMQEVNFDYEIVIGEDCSTDKTREIVVDFQKRYPDRIRLLLPEKNLGSRENGARTLQACRGEYIALLDGDDYWTSPHKLQKQVDFLDNHPECVICFHDVVQFYQDRRREAHNCYPPNLKPILDLEDMLDKTYIVPVSAIYRSGLIDDNLPQEFHHLIVRDWLRFILIAQHGKIGYINEIMGAYRIHQGGMWSGGGPSIDNHIKMRLEQIRGYEAANKYLEYKYDKIMKRRISDFSYSLVKLYRRQENWKKMRKYLLKGFFTQSFKTPSFFSFLVKAFLISFFPDLYRLYRGFRNQHKRIKNCFFHIG